MEEPRAPKDWEFAQLVRFLDEQLRPNEDWSITSEYPIAFSLPNRKNIRIIAEEEKIISHAVMKYLMIKTPFGIFKVAGIGSVVTDPNHRNKGLSTKVLEACVQAAKEENCDLAILWTEIFGFYQKMGFELAGRENSFILNKDITPNNLDLKCVENNQVDPIALRKLYDSHTVATIRSAEDIKKFLQIPNTKLYTAWDQNNNLKAFAVEGRGADLTNYIHEWAGGTQELLALFSHIQAKYENGVVIISPEHSQNLNSQLKSHNLKHHQGNLGMIKITNLNHVMFKLQRYARAIGIDNFIIAQDKDQSIIIGTKKHQYRLKDEAALTRLLFTPGVSKEIKNIDKETKEIFNQILPIPIWVWGWDSV